MHNPIRKAFLILALALGLARGGPAPAEDIALSLDQARELAVHALNSGDPGLAMQVAKGLLQADPKDPFAHYVIAAAYARTGQADAGRQSAARAYRYSEPGVERFRSAQMAARMAYAGNHPTLAQVWLRRSAMHAPDDDAEAVVARDYRMLRRQNPWAFRLRVDLRPSSNVNKGADSALQIIDGVPVTGWLSGSAQALSGLIGSVDLSTTYRLRGDADSVTTIGGRLYVQRVALSDAAKSKAPLAANSDFASTFAELSLRHAFAVGDSGTAAVDLAAGESWWGGDRSFSYARITGERSWLLRGDAVLVAHALVEDRFRAQYSVNDARVLGVGAELSQPLRNGDRLTWTLALRDTDAQHPNGTSSTASLRIGYAFGKPVGPVRLSGGVVLGYTDYPTFWSAGFIPVPGGRQDRSVYGDLNLFFPDMDYAGFAPMLRLRAGRKTSNDSRYSMREVTVSMTVESKF